VARNPTTATLTSPSADITNASVNDTFSLTATIAWGGGGGDDPNEVVHYQYSTDNTNWNDIPSSGGSTLNLGGASATESWSSASGNPSGPWTRTVTFAGEGTWYVSVWVTDGSSNVRTGTTRIVQTTQLNAYDHNATGGAATGGTATVVPVIINNYDHNASGGAATGGAATVVPALIQHYDHNASGGAATAGAATCVYTPVAGDYSLLIDASGEYARRTANLPPANSFTVCGWWRMDARKTSDYQTVFSLDNASSTWITLQWDNANNFLIHRNGSSGVFTTTPSAGNWYFWAVTSDGTTITARLWSEAGTLLDTKSCSYANPSATAMYVGNNGWDEYDNGKHKHVRVWDTVLTLDEIVYESRSDWPIRTQNLNTAFDSDGTDLSGNSRNWTVTGSSSSVVPTLPDPLTPIMRGQSTQAGVGSNTYEFTVNVPSDATKLIVFVGSGMGTTANTATATWNGTGMTKFAYAEATDQVWAMVTAFYLDSPDTGSHTLAVAQSGNNQWGVAAIPLKSAETGAPAYGTAGWLSTDANPRVVTVSGSVDDDLLVAAHFDDYQTLQTTSGSGGIDIGYHTLISSDSDFGAQYKLATGANGSLSFTTTSGPDRAASIIVAVGVSSLNAFDHNATGGAATGGTATVSRTVAFNYDASGGLTSGGSATVARTVAFAHAASGGAVTGGDATESYQVAGTDFPHTASGGGLLAGAATILRTIAFAFVATGGVAAAGAATTSYNSNFDHDATGGATTAGAATVDWNPNPTFKYWSAQYWSTDYWGRYWPLQGGTGAQDYPHTASGGAATGGTATVSRTAAYDHNASGGAVTGGAATSSFVLNFVHSASGGAATSGAANVSFLDIVAYAHAATGGANTGGSATVSRTVAYDFNPSGGVVTSGTATVSRTIAFNFDASGGVVTGGDATEYYTGVGGTNFPHAASGGAGTGGTATVVRTVAFDYDSSGGGTTGGTSTSVQGHNHDATGGATTAGSATLAFTHAWDRDASGGAATGGSATVTRTVAFDFNASGGGSLSGAANAAFNSLNNYSHAATGGTNTSGAATVARTVARVYSASGGGTTGGEASEKLGCSHDASGGVVASGSATVAFTQSFSHTASGGSLSGGSAAIANLLNHDAVGGAVLSGESFCIYVPSTGTGTGGRLRRFIQPFAS